MSVTVPTLKIRNILLQFIEVVRADYSTKLALDLESESWLYRVFYGVEYGEYNFYTQAKEVIINRDNDNPRKLTIRYSFDKVKSNLPCIVINNPAENTGIENSIGVGVDMYYAYENFDGSTVNKHKRNFSGAYELMVISDNLYEAELLYTFLKALFTAGIDTLHDIFDGIVTFSGKNLIPNSELIPSNLYIKSFILGLEDTIEVPSLALDYYATYIRIAEATIYDYEGNVYNDIVYYGDAIGSDIL